MTDRSATAPAQAIFEEAVALYREGYLDKAEGMCRALLQKQPRHVDALNLAGVIAYQSKAYGRAVEMIDAAIAVNPGHANAHNVRGAALMELDRAGEALASFDQALALKPGESSAQNNRGNALRALGRPLDALSSYDVATVLSPDYADAWHNRGLALCDLRRFDAAIESCARAIALKPDFADAYRTRGLALKELGRLAAALADYDKAVALVPNSADAWNDRGMVLQALRRDGEALSCYDKAVALQPSFARALSNRGAVLDRQGRYDEALQSHDRAVALDADLANAWNNRGATLVNLSRRTDALESYAKAVSLDPNHADAHWNMSLCFLQFGDFAKGWAGHEWRWKCAGLGLEVRDFRQPLWLGAEALDGKTILLHADQGFGDAIQLSRYAKLVRDRGARVVLEVRRPLVSLLKTLDGPSQIVAYGDALPDFDVHCSLASLPFAFKTDAASIPAATGYLESDGGKLAEWRGLLGPQSPPRVGLAWSGNPRHTNDHNRSIPLADLLPMLPGGIEYTCLQKDVSAADKEVLASRPDIRHFGDRLADFADTAALCALMDVVVSVDTSLAHLAGALARPVWILLPFNPDWRWLLERTDSPWYASATLYRQARPADWRGVLEKLSVDLSRRLGRSA